MRGMQSENEKLRTKSAFLLLNLLTSHPEHKGKLTGDDSWLMKSVFNLVKLIFHFQELPFLKMTSCFKVSTRDIVEYGSCNRSDALVCI